jgi:uncharacterized protein
MYNGKYNYQKSYIMINRTLQQQIEKWLNQKKVLIIYGARQVGKTTISQNIIKKLGHGLYLSCENIKNKTLLESQDIPSIVNFFGENKLIILDEAQKVRDIGSILKQLIDTHPQIQIIATGSSSFQLSNIVNEPLTGRNMKFQLHPISILELVSHSNIPEVNSNIEHYLRFGSYPETLESSDEIAMDKLDVLAGDYLYRDVLSFENLQRTDLLQKLLKALAFQVGSEVTYRELAKLLDSNHNTIAKYIDLLEQCFIIYKLNSFSRNHRNELKNGFKIYFWDLGIRNSLIQNFNRMENRADVGALWENFCINERIKTLQANNQRANLYFWRSTIPNKEIDFVEERDGKLQTYEFKWNPKASGNARLPKVFLETYGGILNKDGSSNIVDFKVVDNGNWWNYLI